MGAIKFSMQSLRVGAHIVALDAAERALPAFSYEVTPKWPAARTELSQKPDNHDDVIGAAIAANVDKPAIKRRAIAAYAKWQKVEEKVAATIFD